MSDRLQRQIASILTAIVAVLVLAAEGSWWPEATVWLHRAVAAIAAVSSVMGWGVVLPGRR